MIATDGVWTTEDRHAYFLAGDGRPSRTGDPHKGEHLVAGTFTAEAVYDTDGDVVVVELTGAR